MIQRHDVNKWYWKKGTNRLAQLRVATNLQFVKNAVSAKLNKVKHNEMRYLVTQQIYNEQILKSA